MINLIISIIALLFSVFAAAYPSIRRYHLRKRGYPMVKRHIELLSTMIKR